MKEHFIIYSFISMTGIVRTNYDYKMAVVSGHKNEIKMLTSQNCYLKIVWQGE